MCAANEIRQSTEKAKKFLSRFFCKKNFEVKICMLVDFLVFNNDKLRLSYPLDHYYRGGLLAGTRIGIKKGKINREEFGMV